MKLRSLGERNNDSSIELTIAFLCLEDAARRRGLIQTRASRRMDWLDLEGINNLMNDIRVQDWLTGS